MLGLHCRIPVDEYSDFIFLNSQGTPFNPASVDGWLSRKIKSYNDSIIFTPYPPFCSL